MGRKPLISVCIPVFNGERFLAETIEAILAQTVKDFELLIADDKSTDRSAAVVRSFGDSRIKLFENRTNLGMAKNWEKVMSYAQGNYVKLLGQDDLLHPNCLERQALVLEAPLNSNVVLTVCNRKVIDGSGRVVLRRRFPFRTGSVRGDKLIRYCLRGGTNLIGEPVVGLFRREPLLKIAKLNDSNPYMLDLALWAELLKFGEAFVDSSFLASFRVCPGTASFTIGTRQAAYFRKFVRNLRNDSTFRPSLVDSCLGYVLSFQWCVLRNVILRLNAC